MTSMLSIYSASFRLGIQGASQQDSTRYRMIDAFSG